MGPRKRKSEAQRERLKLSVYSALDRGPGLAASYRLGLHFFISAILGRRLKGLREIFLRFLPSNFQDEQIILDIGLQ
ncbi:MAG: hypothetical protein AMJ79_08025 [Phycisphaerae bacterium SM23_30]|nr:MAG: hypothetical protein AMJ79_08025 [Phycisphaerae bacterium SM23_30]